MPAAIQASTTTALNSDASSSQRSQSRLVSGVKGLDDLLLGGFVRGGIYMVMGRPGAGKTILGNQICFNHVRAGGRALYVTVLTESHARLLAGFESMDFFDPQFLANSLTYLSGYQALTENRLDGLLRLLREAVRDHKASLLVIDGLVTPREATAEETDTKKFLHDLQVMTELVGCTSLLLTGTRSLDGNYAERTMVDGLIQLNSVRVGMRTVRELEVQKHRGSRTILGTHFYEISTAGITVHPRLESLSGPPPEMPPSQALMPFSIRSLDAMFHGGLPPGSSTVLLGSPGSGKTSLGLHFLLGGGADEPGLYWGFQELPSRIRSKATRLALPLDERLSRGRIVLEWRAPMEQLADALASELLATVRRGGFKRVFIDGLFGFTDSLIYPERTAPFLTALSNELRAAGATTVYAMETRDMHGSNLELPLAIAPVADTVVLVRYVELRSRLHRLISLLKCRESAHDTSIREFVIGDDGVRVGDIFPGVEDVLSGMAHIRTGAGAARKKKQQKRAATRRPRRA